MCGSTALWAVTSSAKPLYCLDVGRMLLTNYSLHYPPKSTVHYTTKYSHAYAVGSMHIDHTPPDFSSLFHSFFLFSLPLLPSSSLFPFSLISPQLPNIRRILMDRCLSSMQVQYTCGMTTTHHIERQALAWWSLLLMCVPCCLPPPPHFLYIISSVPLYDNLIISLPFFSPYLFSLTYLNLPLSLSSTFLPSSLLSFPPSSPSLPPSLSLSLSVCSRPNPNEGGRPAISAYWADNTQAQLSAMMATVTSLS